MTWGTSPEDVVAVTEEPCPTWRQIADETRRAQVQRALDYMGLASGQRIDEARIDVVFIGSCTNSRIEDPACGRCRSRKGRKVAGHVRAMVVPGSGLVKEQAEAEGLDAIFVEAGFEWREPGCSMCLAMNPDKLEPGQRCASTSNRNFEGRQGRGGRTHLMSPAMAAAAAAVAGSDRGCEEPGLTNLVKGAHFWPMKQLDLYEAKTNLSSIVDEAMAGEDVIIAKNGKPCVRLVPVNDPAPKKPRQFGYWGKYGFKGA